jgi:transcriptional regulator with XRE-family HTH domain
MAVEALLQQLVAQRERAGLTQSDVADRMETSQSVIARLEAGRRDPRLSTLERYAAAVGAHIQLEPRVERTASANRRTAARLAELVRARLGSGASSTATFREVVQFLDGARSADQPTLRSLIHEPPSSTGDDRWDATVAAAVEWVAATGGVASPAWARSPDRKLDSPGWVLTPHRQLHEMVRANTPPAFARHGVYVDADSLGSV